MTDKVTPALVLGLHYSSLPVARSLGRKGIPVYGIDASDDMLGRFSRYVTRLPAPEDGDELRDFLIDLARRLDTKLVAIPMSDAYVLFLAKYHDALADHYLYPMTDPTMVTKLVSKRESDRIFTDLGIDHPKSILLKRGCLSAPEAGDLTFPCLLKPSFHHTWENNPIFRELVGRSQRVMLVREYAVLQEAIKILNLIDDTLLQEFVVGPSENHYYYVGYRDRRGRILTSFVGNKIRTLLDCQGSETLLRSVHRPDILRHGDEILSRLDYHGPAGIDFKYDSRDNALKVIEINCRIGINDCYLMRYGLDLPDFYYQDSRGADVLPRRDYPAGIIWHDLFRDLEWMQMYRRLYNVSWRQWLGQLQGRGTEALFDWSDPVPFIRSVATLLLRVLRRAGRALWKVSKSRYQSPLALPSAMNTDSPAETERGADSPHILVIKDCVLEAIFSKMPHRPNRETGHIIALELRSLGFRPDQVRVILLSGWNQHNDCPLTGEEIRQIVDEAYDGELCQCECKEDGPLRRQFHCVGENNCLYRKMGVDTRSS